MTKWISIAPGKPGYQAFAGLITLFAGNIPMRCLTDTEVSAWLRQRSIDEDPYGSGQGAMHYLQFHAPDGYRRLQAFVRCYFEAIAKDSESLVHVTDWVFSEQSEMIAIEGIRQSCGDSRRLIDAPGHWLEAGEEATGISLFSLSAAFEWRSYLYCPRHRSTLYNWEGEIFDFWTDDEAFLLSMRVLIERFGLKETSEAEPQR